MNTQYEIRGPDLSGIFISFDRESHALDWWREHVKDAPPTGTHYGAVVVRHTWETHAEAETARLDFMLGPGAIAQFSAACTRLPREAFKLASEWPRWARVAIDRARNAPESTLDVIWPRDWTPRDRLGPIASTAPKG